MLLRKFTAIILAGFLTVAKGADEADSVPCAPTMVPLDNTAIPDSSPQKKNPSAPFFSTFPATASTAPSVPFPLAQKKGTFDWSFCGTTTAYQPSIADQPLDRSTPIDIYSDHATVHEQDTAILWGNVRLAHPGEILETPWLIYDLNFDMAQAQYGLRYRRGGLSLEGKEGFFDMEYSRGTINEVHYRLAERHARGTATTIQVEDRERSRYTEATYSTCPEGQDDWILQAQSLDLDQARGRGIGHHVTTYFKGVPLFYIPYLSFPISGKRESGFLIPSIGTSSRSGLDLRIPYYWNLAPNYDATLTTRLITRRGVQFNTEFRYLSALGSGQVDVEYLPHDQLDGEARGLFSFQHAGNITPRISSDVVFGAVSDDNYFHDLGNTLQLTSLSYLERRSDISYIGDGWSGLGRIQGFQTIDNSRPFGRLPQLQVKFYPSGKSGGPEYSAIGEISNFYRATIDNGIANNQNYTGTRLWLQPSIAYPFNGLNGFFTPRLTLHQIYYTLQDTAPGLPSTPSLTLPIFSLDSGLFLERNVTFGEQNFIQTLEPRIYYLYVPYKNQENLPIFDTTLLDFSFGQLFRENRFSGPDRLGDANQLAIAVTSRLLESSRGTQTLYGSLGQILYLRDRETTLDYGIDNTTIANKGNATSRSDVVAEVGLRLGKYWTGSSTVQWNQQQGQPEKRSLRLRYQSDQNHIFNFSYRNRRDLLEQTDISTAWPLNRQWRAIAHWNYSLQDRQTLESFAGLRYDSCCWALQIVGRRYVNLPGEDPKSDIILQLELKGLANIGERLDPFLSNNIFGYPMR